MFKKKEQSLLDRIEMVNCKYFLTRLLKFSDHCKYLIAPMMLLALMILLGINRYSSNRGDGFENLRLVSDWPVNSTSDWLKILFETYKAMLSSSICWEKWRLRAWKQARCIKNPIMLPEIGDHQSQGHQRVNSSQRLRSFHIVELRSRRLVDEQ